MYLFEAEQHLNSLTIHIYIYLVAVIHAFTNVTHMHTLSIFLYPTDEQRSCQEERKGDPGLEGPLYSSCVAVSGELPVTVLSLVRQRVLLA